MKITLLILIFITGIFQFAFSQEIKKSSLWEDTRYVPKVGYSYQKGYYLEVGVIRGFIAESHGPNLGVIGPFISTDINTQNLILGPKLGFEFSFLLLSGKVSSIAYTDFKKVDLRFTPEIGLTLLGYLTICWGYNLKLNSNSFDDVGSNKFSININFMGSQ